MITVMLVEDHASFRQALEAVLALEEDLDVVAHVTRGDLAGDAAGASQPDVAVIDLDLPGAGGVDAIADIRSNSPETACMVLTALKDEVELGRAVEAGALAVVHKSIDITELLAAIRAVSRGVNLLTPDDTVRWLQALGSSRNEQWEAGLLRESLTPREAEVLNLLAQGEGNRTIAEHLGISPETVQTHIRNLLGKFDVGSRLEAVAKALRLRLIEPPH